MDPFTYVTALVLVGLAWKFFGGKKKTDETHGTAANVYLHG